MWQGVQKQGVSGVGWREGEERGSLPSKDVGVAKLDEVDKANMYEADRYDAAGEFE